MKKCKFGHEMSQENILVENDRQKCRACARERQMRMHVRSGDFLARDTKPKISGYKEPLTPVSNGFGYYGTVAWDETEMFIQCHICGYFVKSLGMHSSKYHGITTKEYKQKYGLASRTSLIAPERRKNWQNPWTKMSEEQRQALLKRLKEGHIQPKGGGFVKKSLEQKNREGRCPEQLLSKVRDLADELKKTPTKRQFIKKYGEGYLNSLYMTYGTWNEAIKILGLTANGGGTSNPVYTEEAVIEALQGFKREFGREPLTKDIEDYRLPSPRVYRRIFGSFGEAKKVAFNEAVSL